MLRLFHDTNIDFLGHKAAFMSVSVAVLLLGLVGVVTRGFNLGVDFAGGTLVRASFVKAPTPDQVRDALTAEGVEASKVTIQPTVGTRGGEGLLIRLPGAGTAEAGAIGTERRTIMRALNSISPTPGAEGGKTNLNATDSTELAAELRRLGVDPGVDVDSVANRIIAARDAMPSGVFASLDEVRQVPDVPPAVADIVARDLYAGKLDINSIGGERLLDALRRLDPLGLKGDPAAAQAQYTQARDAIIDYRDRQRDGVVSSVEEIPLDQFDPRLKQTLAQSFVVGNFNIVNAEAVGEAAGDDFRNRAVYVTLASLLGMLIYIAFRFEWIYGVGAVVAVFHDAMICLGLFALFQWEINLTVVAALLTLIGFSTNDTIVIFDRIRENLRLQRRRTLYQITNDAVNQTLSRTIIASGTAFLTVLVLLLFGGDVLKSFSLVLFIGIIFGSYSSIGIAAPIMLWWQERHKPAARSGAPANRVGEPRRTRVAPTT